MTSERILEIVLTALIAAVLAVNLVAFIARHVHEACVWHGRWCLQNGRPVEKLRVMP